jgi:hypothetical protein
MSETIIKPSKSSLADRLVEARKGVPTETTDNPWESNPEDLALPTPDGVGTVHDAAGKLDAVRSLATPYVGRHRAEAPAQVTPVTPEGAHKNWNDMMTAERAKATQEREAKIAQEAAIAAAYAPKTSGLLDDSEVVQSHRARRLHLSPLTKLKHARDVRRMDKDFKSLQKQQVKEMKAFDKDAAKERALQVAEDNATVKGAGREERLEDKLFQKRLNAEARLKAKQDKQMERFNEREARRLRHRKSIGRTAARASLFIGR